MDEDILNTLKFRDYFSAKPEYVWILLKDINHMLS